MFKQGRFAAVNHAEPDVRAGVMQRHGKKRNKRSADKFLRLFYRKRAFCRHAKHRQQRAAYCEAHPCEKYQIRVKRCVYFKNFVSVFNKRKQRAPQQHDKQANTHNCGGSFSVRCCHGLCVVLAVRRGCLFRPVRDNAAFIRKNVHTHLILNLTLFIFSVRNPRFAYDAWAFFLRAAFRLSRTKQRQHCVYTSNPPGTLQ